jgi:hypothetical protein
LIFCPSYLLTMSLVPSHNVSSPNPCHSYRNQFGQSYSWLNPGCFYLDHLSHKWHSYSDPGLLLFDPPLFSKWRHVGMNFSLYFNLIALPVSQILFWLVYSIAWLYSSLEFLNNLMSILKGLLLSGIYICACVYLSKLVHFSLDCLLAFWGLWETITSWFGKNYLSFEF